MEVMEALCRYDWPGNVRELMNVIERAMLLCRTGTISLSDLPNVFSGGGAPPESRMEPLFDISGWPRKPLPQVQAEVLEQVERLYFHLVLKETRGRVGEAARIAGIHPRGMYNKLKRLGIKKEDFK